MENKRGQFYIVAAIIIVLALSGVASVTTYAVVKSKPKTIYGVSAELKEESSRIIDYGIYNENDIEQLLGDFTDKYGDYFLKKTDNANILFIYGDSSGNLKAYRYKESSAGTITASLGTGLKWSSLTSIKEEVIVNRDNQGHVIVKILGKDYKFEIKGDEVFYFAIVQEREGEIYIERN